MSEAADREPTTSRTTIRPDTAAEPEPSLVRFEPPPWRWIWGVLGAIVVSFLGAWLFVTFFRAVAYLLIWVLIALFASFALEPAVDWLAKRGWRRGVATASILLGVAIGAVAMVALMIPLLVEQLKGLIEAAPGILENVSTFTKRWFGVEVSPAALQQQLQDANSGLSAFATNIAGNVFGFASSIIGSIFKLLTIGLFTFYLVADGPKFRRAICSFLPRKGQVTVLWTWEVAIEKTGQYLYSRLLLAIFSGVATFTVLMVLGVPFAVPLAVWMGLVSQFIPTIGTYIAMALPLLVAVVDDPYKALWLLIFFTAYQQIENYLLSPRITARTMSLHPALAFGCAIAGAGISGIVGAFLALPAAAIIQAVGSTFVQRHEIVETELTKVMDSDEVREEREGVREQRRAAFFDRLRERVARAPGRDETGVPGPGDG